jgi:uncharacterized BrkB/YihY/UPF0761 family membrane protein
MSSLKRNVRDAWDDSTDVGIKILAIIGIVVGFLVLVGGIALALAMLNGFVLMVIAGAIHHSVWAALPAFSYWQSVLIAFAITFVAGLFRGVSSSSKDD